MNIQNLMFAVKSKKANQNSVLIASKIAKAFGSQATALHFGDSEVDYASDFLAGKLSTEDYSGSKGVKDIIKSLEQANYELLIIPVQTEKAPEGLLTPSDANRLIDHFEKVVLTIPDETNSLQFNHIVVPIDTSFETRQKAPYAVALAKAFNATLHVLGVSKETGKDAEVMIKNYTRQVSNNFEEKGLNTTIELRLGGNPTKQIIEYTEEINAGMIVIMTEQENNFSALFSGKYSEQMIKNAHVPVVSIHPKDLVVSSARL